MLWNIIIYAYCRIVCENIFAQKRQYMKEQNALEMNQLEDRNDAELHSLALRQKREIQNEVSFWLKLWNAKVESMESLVRKEHRLYCLYHHLRNAFQRSPNRMRLVTKWTRVWKRHQATRKKIDANWRVFRSNIIKMAVSIVEKHSAEKQHLETRHIQKEVDLDLIHEERLEEIDEEYLEALRTLHDNWPAC